MNDKRIPNVTLPEEFSHKLQEVMTGIFELLELTKEYDTSPIGDDGIKGYIDECGKNYFHHRFLRLRKF
jgi:hypothetical protein